MSLFEVFETGRLRPIAGSKRQTRGEHQLRQFGLLLIIVAGIVAVNVAFIAWQHWWCYFLFLPFLPFCSRLGEGYEDYEKLWDSRN
ncbi:MAG: hypothetical protein QM648_07555 [Solirubrobacterales bacterium]